MSSSMVVLGILVTAVLIRQVFVLVAVARSARFLRQTHVTPPAVAATAGSNHVFFIIVPILRETAIIAESVVHFAGLARGHAVTLVIVTTAREAAEESPHQGSKDTITLVDELTSDGGFVHLHYPDAAGLKADQLNFAAAYCASTLPRDAPSSHAFMICYDADSRPPLGSLADFAQAIANFPESSVFHQSSRFELRTAPQRPGRGLLTWLSRAVCDGGALRANRFVLGFELPRLINRTGAVGSVKRRACSYVYAHVTTHGLCVRLSLLLELPFPARSPLEDMHYSFYLGSRDLPMVAVPSLDRAEVPESVTEQVRQAARWFYGPGRFLCYLRDPATQHGWRARAQAVSACGSAIEWLGCAVIPSSAIVAVLLTEGLLRAAAGVLVALYAAQLVLTDRVLGSHADRHMRLVRMLACPMAATLFGLGGFLGAARLLSGGSGIGKTERRESA
jgi:hypothetical protein